MLCDVVQDGVNFAKSLGPSGHFGIYILANKIQKAPFSGRSEPISNAVYNTLAIRGIRTLVNGP